MWHFLQTLLFCIEYKDFSINKKAFQNVRYKIILKLANSVFCTFYSALKIIFEAAYCQGKPFSDLVFVCFGETLTHLTVSVGRMLLLEKKGRGGGGGKGERKSYKACASPRSPSSLQKVICLQEEDIFLLFCFREAARFGLFRGLPVPQLELFFCSFVAHSERENVSFVPFH